MEQRLDAHAILENVDNKVYVKVPVTEEGLKAIRILKSEGVGITATAIYTTTQGLLAMESGADYIAPYYNRMENMNIDPRTVIQSFAQMIDTYNYNTVILAASFKNIAQVNESFMCGAQTATMDVDILRVAMSMPAIQKAVDDFAADWDSVYGVGTTIPSLVR